MDELDKTGLGRVTFDVLFEVWLIVLNLDELIGVLFEQCLLFFRFGSLGDLIDVDFLVLGVSSSDDVITWGVREVRGSGESDSLDESHETLV